MKRTLYLKFLAGYLAFHVLAFFVVATFTTHSTYRYMLDTEADNLYRQAKIVASNYAASYFQDNLTLMDIQEQLAAFDSYLKSPIWIIDAKGNILINSRGGSDETHPEAIPDFDITSFGTSYYQTGDFFHTLPGEYLSVYAPININYKVQGYVLIHRQITQINRYSDGFINIAYVSLIFIFLCSLLLLLLFTCTIYRPIQHLCRVAKKYSSGNFEDKITVRSNNELGYLAASINYMASELQTLEDDQRKFIANVSHDFRSPLTSIKGYIEAIMDGTIPPEMQDRYLGIILTETERLNKLTQSMLELNKYGSHGKTILDISSFDLNTIIKNTALSFEGTCMQKRISFELILTEQTLFVTADMSKIQQVLYNLIDNAIKFSPDGSAITIETTERNDKVFVSVKDSGIGIPKDSIHKVWERFYKTDLSRGKDKKGTGLGLAIVKDIISAHNENINVISTEGVGTEFIFTLPLAKLRQGI